MGNSTDASREVAQARVKRRGGGREEGKRCNRKEESERRKGDKAVGCTQSVFFTRGGRLLNLLAWRHR
jgi:hypothetical protein